MVIARPSFVSFRTTGLGLNVIQESKTHGLRTMPRTPNSPISVTYRISSRVSTDSKGFRETNSVG